METLESFSHEPVPCHQAGLTIPQEGQQSLSLLLEVIETDGPLARQGLRRGRPLLFEQVCGYIEVFGAPAHLLSPLVPGRDDLLVTFRNARGLDERRETLQLDAGCLADRLHDRLVKRPCRHRFSRYLHVTSLHL